MISYLLIRITRDMKNFQTKATDEGNEDEFEENDEVDDDVSDDE